MRRFIPAFIFSVLILGFVLYLLRLSWVPDQDGPKESKGSGSVKEQVGRFRRGGNVLNGSRALAKRSSDFGTGLAKGESQASRIRSSVANYALSSSAKSQSHSGQVPQASEKLSKEGSLSSFRRLSGKGSCSVIGVVINEEGASVPGVSVLLEGKGGGENSVSDHEGTVVFTELPPGRYRLSAKFEGSLLKSSGWVSLSEGQTRKVTLRVSDADSYIKGRCLDTDGNPLSGVKIEARPAEEGEVLTLWPYEEGFVRTESGKEGFYEIGPLPKGIYRVSGLWPVTGEKVPKNVSAPASGVDFLFKAPFEVKVEGYCVDPQGAPIEGALVSVMGRNPVSVRTDRSGAYSLVTKTISWWGTLYLRAWKEGYRRTEKTLSLKGEERQEGFRVDFILKPLQGGGAIEGVLIDEEGTCVSGEVIYLSSPSARVSKSARSREDGSFRFTELDPAGDYTLAVFPRKKYKDLQKRGIHVADGETTKVELVLEFADLGSIEGVALDANGQPLAGFLFRIRSTQSWSQDIKVVTAPDGTFVAEEVPAGEIMFDTRSSPNYSIRGLRLAPGERKQVRLVFGVGNLRVEGIVQSPEGAPLPGVRVSLAWVRSEGGLTSSFLRTTVTDNEGWYRMTGLPPGKYTVTADKMGMIPHRSTRDLSENARWDITLPKR